MISGSNLNARLKLHITNGNGASSSTAGSGFAATSTAAFALRSRRLRHAPGMRRLEQSDSSCSWSAGTLDMPTWPINAEGAKYTSASEYAGAISAVTITWSTTV